MYRNLETYFAVLCGSVSGRILNFWPDPDKIISDPGNSGSEMADKLIIKSEFAVFMQDP
jgi:hypothetical protein